MFPAPRLAEIEVSGEEGLLERLEGGEEDLKLFGAHGTISEQTFEMAGRDRCRRSGKIDGYEMGHALLLAREDPCHGLEHGKAGEDQMFMGNDGLPVARVAVIGACPRLTEEAAREPRRHFLEHDHVGLRVFQDSEQRGHALPDVYGIGKDVVGDEPERVGRCRRAALGPRGYRAVEKDRHRKARNQATHRLRNTRRVRLGKSRPSSAGVPRLLRGAAT